MALLVSLRDTAICFEDEQDFLFFCFVLVHEIKPITLDNIQGNTHRLETNELNERDEIDLKKTHINKNNASRHFVLLIFRCKSLFINIK